ncbi:uncharacterized protein [Nicotiana sylvestris]|uniref:uncharacterized protein n=1 Tax=Nicotiana sylvestris TaxID=4096 RepID=UPI00388C8CAD
MKTYLEALHLREVVEEDYDVLPLPSNPTMAQRVTRKRKPRKTKKSKAKATLFAGVSATIFTRVMALKSAKEIWDYLKGEYTRDERIRSMKVLNLIREFELQKMKESETVKEYSDRLFGIVTKIRLLDLKEINDMLKYLLKQNNEKQLEIERQKTTIRKLEAQLSQVIGAFNAQQANIEDSSQEEHEFEVLTGEVRVEHQQPIQLKFEDVNVEEVRLESAKDIEDTNFVDSSIIDVEDAESPEVHVCERIGPHSKYFSTLCLDDNMEIESSEPIEKSRNEEQGAYILEFFLPERQDYIPHLKAKKCKRQKITIRKLEAQLSQVVGAFNAQQANIEDSSQEEHEFEVLIGEVRVEHQQPIQLKFEDVNVEEVRLESAKDIEDTNFVDSSIIDVEDAESPEVHVCERIGPHSKYFSTLCLDDNMEIESSEPIEKSRNEEQGAYILEFFLPERQDYIPHLKAKKCKRQKTTIRKLEAQLSQVVGAFNAQQANIEDSSQEEHEFEVLTGEVRVEHQQPIQLKFEDVNVEEVRLESAKDIEDTNFVDSSIIDVEDAESPEVHVCERIGPHSKYFFTLCLDDNMEIESSEPIEKSRNEEQGAYILEFFLPERQDYIPHLKAKKCKRQKTIIRKLEAQLSQVVGAFNAQQANIEDSSQEEHEFEVLIGEVRVEHQQPIQLKFEDVNVEEVRLESAKDIEDTNFVDSSIIDVEDAESPEVHVYERIGPHSKYFSTLCLDNNMEIESSEPIEKSRNEEQGAYILEFFLPERQDYIPHLKAKKCSTMIAWAN